MTQRVARSGGGSRGWRSGPVRRGACAVVVACLGLPLLPAGAWASGLALPRVGDAGRSVTTVDAASIWYNPGSLAWMNTGEIAAGGALVGGSVSYRRERRGRYAFADGLDFALPVAAGDLDPDKTGWDRQVGDTPLSLAGDLFLAAPVGTRVTAGLGVYAPWGAVVDLPPDGPQRWAVQQATLLSIHITPTVAVQVGDWGLGGGVSWMLGYAGLSRVQDLAELDALGRGLAQEPFSQANDFGPQAPTAVRELDVLSRPLSLTDARGQGVSFNLGVSWRPTSAWTVGLSYHHGGQVEHEGDVRLDMDDPFFTGDLEAQGLRFPPRVEGRGVLGIRWPHVVRAGAAWELSPAWTLDAQVSLVGWSTVDRLRVRVEAADLAQPALGLPATLQVDVVRNWRDAVEAELRVHRFGRGPWSAWGMLGVHSQAAPDQTMDLASIDGVRVVGGAGVAWRLRPTLTWSVDASIHQMVPRRVTGSAADRGNGEYGLTLGALGSRLRWQFGHRAGT